MIESLVENEFDITSCQEMLVDHAFVGLMRLLWPDHDHPPIKSISIEINTVQHPLPKTLRCYNLGRAIDKAIESYEEDLKVVIVGTGECLINLTVRELDLLIRNST